MVTLKVKQFAQKGFLDAFNKLMNVNELDVADKMSLVRLNKSLTEEFEVAKEACKNQDDVAQVMEQDVQFDVEFSFTAEKLAEHISAADIANLYPLLTKEEL